MGPLSTAFLSPLAWNRGVRSFGSSISSAPAVRRAARPRPGLRAQPVCPKAPFSCSAEPDESGEASTPPKESHITVETAHEMTSHALSKLDGDVHELARKCALGAADAFSQCYPADEFFSIFLTCGPGLNGLVTAHLGVLLKERGYEPSLYSTYPSRHADLPAFCKEHGIELYDFAPSTLDYYYDVLVDGLLGTGFDGGDIREHYWRIYEVLFTTDLPVVSIDVPSGWDLTLGPREIDLTADTFIKPDLLISLGAPKLCAKRFAGSYHYIAGRHVDHEWLAERGVDIPTYPTGSDCVLFSSNSHSFQKGTGEVYGRPGQFNATLYTRNPKRKFVDVEEEMDLWDELD